MKLVDMSMADQVENPWLCMTKDELIDWMMTECQKFTFNMMCHVHMVAESDYTITTHSEPVNINTHSWTGNLCNEILLPEKL